MPSGISSIIAGHLHIALTAWIEEEHSYSEACLVEDRNARVGACMIVANAITVVLVDRVVWDDIDCTEFLTHIPHYWADRSGLIGHETTRELTAVIKAVASGEDNQSLNPVMGIVFEYFDAIAMPYRRE